ncbi:MAG: hypothetical protein ACK5LL_02535 [Suipraeoptans sp.]
MLTRISGHFLTPQVGIEPARKYWNQQIPISTWNIQDFKYVDIMLDNSFDTARFATSGKVKL